MGAMFAWRAHRGAGNARWRSGATSNPRHHNPEYRYIFNSKYVAKLLVIVVDASHFQQIEVFFYLQESRLLI